MGALIKADPTAAADWVPPRLAQLKNPSNQLDAMLQLGLAVADAQPELALQMYRRCKTILNPHDYSQAAALNFARLAGLAGKLKQPEAVNLLQAAIIANDASGDAKMRNNALAGLAAAAAPGGSALLDGVLAELDDGHKVHALWSAIRSVAPDNIAEGLQLLTKLETIVQHLGPIANRPPLPGEQFGPNAEEVLSNARGEIAKVLAATDITSATALARKVALYRRPQILIAVAEQAKGETARGLYREAADCAQEPYKVDVLPRIAAIVYRDDPKLGEEYFAEARASITESRNSQNQPFLRQGYDAYAYYRALTDPASSRLLLEADLAATQSQSAGRQEFQKVYRISKIAEAMAAIDPDRALDIAKPVMNQEYRGNMVHYWLTPPAKREALGFSQR